MSERCVEVEFGPERVRVPEGGYYDRFRMNPDLDEVARDPAAGNIDFFRRIPKQQVDSRVGRVWAPNFFYRMCSVQLLYLAPAARLRAMLPQPLEPLRALPGRGLVALTFFSYLVADNDPYNEVSIAVVVRRPGARGPNMLELIKSMRRRNVYGHVLALPVTTEIARVRGVQGYQLPKWLARIDVSMEEGVRADIAAADGTPDLTLEALLPALRAVPSQSRINTTNMLNLIDGRWHQTKVQTNILNHAEQMLPKGVELTRHGGPMSQLFDGLGVGKIVRMDVVKDGQAVLNMPTPLSALDPKGR
ncbi:hypothetical protein FHS51_000136 [Sphingobium wenxiniae]|uniref:Acetoacetate decarboxylase n=2 Tax=Sphingobium TaxID=165695 RepID=T0GVN8_9SPHN|nr:MULTISPECIES: acetoacetate decarboxylase family protein [Sphingobium]EQB04003.1 hypothetical protein L485_04780 [Sphingobium baderi LL03]KMS63212.1 acetoacetate decarboxylase [Sphingobium baderi LL03]MBB6189933.1 hypothetical protein [Sphingobium wenxiniae]TWH97749.1 acetoacetate decarboxylase [Sphingobium wenxiniae]